MKISVIIPCFNQGDFLKETCSSIQEQTYQNWEVLIINDGSTDNTESISKDICEEDPRFKYFKKKNGGLSSARNYGLNNITGDYVQFLDADDLLKPEKFTLSVNAKVDIAITNFNMYENNTLQPPFCDLKTQTFTFNSVLNNWDFNYSIPIHCGLFASSAIGNIRFNESLKAKEDWFFWLQVLEKNPTTIFINHKLAIYRQHNSNMCKDTSHMVENTKKVHQLIYNSFGGDIKEKLLLRLYNNFDLIENEKLNYLEIKNKYLKYKKLYKKLFFTIIILFLIILILLFLK